MRRRRAFLFFFFNDTAPTEIYTLSLHDALPILTFNSFNDDYGVINHQADGKDKSKQRQGVDGESEERKKHECADRSEEHTSELQSPDHLVCRLLLEKKKTTKYHNQNTLHTILPS